MSVVVMTMNVNGLSHKEFRAILDEMGAEEHQNLDSTKTFHIPPTRDFELLKLGNHRKALRNLPSDV